MKCVNFIVLRVVEITHPNKTYKADALHDMLFALANWSNALPKNDTLRRYLGTLNIDQTTVDWASEGIAHVWTEANYSCNGDAMNHRQKGVIGLFIQGTERVLVENVEIIGVENHGMIGSEKCGTYRQTPGDDAPEDHDSVGYTGGQARGVVITTSKDVVLRNTSVSEILSHESTSYGLHIFNEVNQVCVEGVSITNVTATSVTSVNDPGLALPRVYGDGVYLQELC